MSDLQRNRKAPESPVTETSQQATSAPPAESSARGPSRTSTRTSAAWLGVCIAAVTLVVLVIFMLQNTGSVEVTFLWMHGTLPLAMALLIAAVGAAILTMLVGAARITQLRRRYRRDH